MLIFFGIAMFRVFVLTRRPGSGMYWLRIGLQVYLFLKIGEYSRRLCRRVTAHQGHKYNLCSGQDLYPYQHIRKPLQLSSSANNHWLMARTSRPPSPPLQARTGGGYNLHVLYSVCGNVP